MKHLWKKYFITTKAVEENRARTESEKMENKMPVVEMEVTGLLVGAARVAAQVLMVIYFGFKSFKVWIIISWWWKLFDWSEFWSEFSTWSPSPPPTGGIFPRCRWNCWRGGLPFWRGWEQNKFPHFCGSFSSGPLLCFLSNPFLCPGKETSKEVVVTAGRLVGASAIVLGVAFVVKKYF